jgi:hypothetical protein
LNCIGITDISWSISGPLAVLVVQEIGHQLTKFSPCET